MTWLPIGPDFVFNPRISPFRRLSVRNELGHQGSLASIAIDPSDPRKIYLAQWGWFTGSALFRSQDGGRTWRCLSDTGLFRSTSRLIEPRCLTVHPRRPNVLYMGSGYTDGGADARVYVSEDFGDSFTEVPGGPGEWISQIIADPRDNGLAYVCSPTKVSVLDYAVQTPPGSRPAPSWEQWTAAAAAEPYFSTSLACHIPLTGTPHFFAGAARSGVWHTTDATGDTDPWTLINDDVRLPRYATGDPLHPEGTFTKVFVVLTPRRPSRVYVWLMTLRRPAIDQDAQFLAEGLYTTDDFAALVPWTRIALPGEPDHVGRDALELKSIAPNSPGDGVHDILFTGYNKLRRSPDSGRSWQLDGVGFHDDWGPVAYVPPASEYEPGPGALTDQVPLSYFGCDGGFTRSTRAADPVYAFDRAPDPTIDIGQGDVPSISGVFQNLNHGRVSSACTGYATDEALGALGYLAAMDTGIAASGGSLGWRYIANADAATIAAAPTPAGVKLWGQLGWPFALRGWLDQGGFGAGETLARLGRSGGPTMSGTSNLVTVGAGTDKAVVVGVDIDDVERTLGNAVAGAAGQTFTVSDPADIEVESVLTVDSETVRVSARRAGAPPQFTADFTWRHAAGVKVTLQRRYVARVDQHDIARPISQLIGDQRFDYVAVDRNNENNMYARGDWSAPTALWHTTAAIGPATPTWVRAMDDAPAEIRPGDIAVNGICFDAASRTFVLCSRPANGTDAGGTPLLTALFEIADTTWIALPYSEPAQAAGSSYGSLVAHPTRANVLYAGRERHVFELTCDEQSLRWTARCLTNDPAAGAPQAMLINLIACTLGPPDCSRAVLRAVYAYRGVFEHDISTAEPPGGPLPYLRDHPLDHPWIIPSQDALSDPLHPSRSVWHYQSPDIKVDARQAGTPPFYQTDPETPLGPGSALDHTRFDQLQDNSSNLPGSDLANIHVQLHNHSNGILDNMSVWALWAPAAAGVPALNETRDGGTFPHFWDQFMVTGDIEPALPTNSRWQAVGPPRLLSGISASSPQVATWTDWPVPMLSSGDPGHYCIVVLVHGGTSATRLTETGYVVDEMVLRNRLIAQKNLHIVGPLGGTAGGGSGGSRSGGPPGGWDGHESRDFYVQFHNPHPGDVRDFDLIFDLRELPGEIETTFKFSSVRTRAPLSDSLRGVARTRMPLPWEGLLDQIRRGVVGWLFGRGAGGRSGNPRIDMLTLGPTVYTAAERAYVVVEGVQLPAHSVAAALVTLRVTSPLPPGAEYRIDVQQREKQRVVGGSTYVVRTADGADVLTVPNMPEPPNWPQRSREKERAYVAPWVRDNVFPPGASVDLDMSG